MWLQVNGRRTLEHVFVPEGERDGVLAVRRRDFPHSEYGACFGKVPSLALTTPSRAATLGPHEVAFWILRELFFGFRLQKAPAEVCHVATPLMLFRGVDVFGYGLGVGEMIEGRYLVRKVLGVGVGERIGRKGFVIVIAKPEERSCSRLRRYAYGSEQIQEVDCYTGWEVGPRDSL